MDSLKNARFTFFLFTTISGILILLNFIDFQNILAQGDHGLNLYVAEAVMRGERPYHDFHWFYGPLMPYYYALFFKLFGISIKSILIGECFLKLMAGLLIYLSLSLFIAPSLSFLSAIWFWLLNHHFEHTFNHTGGIAGCLFVVYVIFFYLKHPKIRYLYLGLLGCFITGLIKINIGLSCLAAFIVSVIVINLTTDASPPSQRKNFYIFSIVVCPIIMIGINWLFVYDLPFYIISQCFQYFGNDILATEYANIDQNILTIITSTYKSIVASKIDFILFCIVLSSLSYFGVQLNRGKIKNSLKNQLFIITAILLIFYIANLHEFIISGRSFRVLWSAPFKILLIFTVLGFATCNISKQTRSLLCISLFIFAFIHPNNNILKYRYKHANFFFSHPRANIFINNNNSPEWVKTVSDASEYLNKHLKEDELFFAFPYEPLYYFLMGKPSPTRQLVFFEYIQIPEEQEKSIIHDLEKNKVNWIILSNRLYSYDVGFGIWGQDYCPLIKKYIKDNFEVKTNLGSWNRVSGWIEHHGVSIVKRKGS